VKIVERSMTACLAGRRVPLMPRLALLGALMRYVVSCSERFEPAFI
jgi:hypothetical protein